MARKRKSGRKKKNPTSSRYLDNGNVQQSTNKPFLELFYWIYFLFMRPATITSFIKDAGDLIKRDKRFRRRLIIEAKNQGVLPKEKGWNTVIDAEDSASSTVGQTERCKKFAGGFSFKPDSHFYFLTTNYTIWFELEETTYDKSPYVFKNKNHLRYFTSSVFELLKTMRNNLVHFEDFPPEVKRKLGWATEKDNELIFQQSLFVDYWNRRFPNLLYFLWKEFYYYKKHLNPEYYPCEMDSRTVNWNNTLSQELTNLSKALDTDVLKHGLAGCYTSDDKRVQLEFRNLSDCALLPLGTCSAVYIGISGKDLNVISRIGMGTSTSVNYKIDPSQQPLSVVVKHSKKELDLEFWGHCVGSQKVIVFLQDSNDMKRVLQQMEEVFEQEFQPVEEEVLQEHEQTIGIQTTLANFFQHWEIIKREKKEKFYEILRYFEEFNENFDLECYRIDIRTHLYSRSVPILHSLYKCNWNYWENSVDIKLEIAAKLLKG